MLVFIITLFACTIGGICGLGGGTLLKPIFSLMSIMTTEQSTFMCSITVLIMAFLSVLLRKKDKLIKYQLSTALAFGAIFGGLFGKKIFYICYNIFTDNQVGIIQAIVLVVILIWLVVYNLWLKNKIKTLNVNNNIVSFCIGLFMGVVSTFLGIGGGAINLTILFYFFSMNISQAAINSLYIIILSQTAGLSEILITNSIPEFNYIQLILMIIGATCGSIISTKLVHKFDKKIIDKIFICLLFVAIIICSLNIYLKVI